MKPIKDIKLKEKTTANELIKKLKEAGGFSAKNVALGVDVLEKMVKDKNCVKFLSFPACIIATGTRGVINEMVKRKMVDVIITTCGTLDHDLARVWKDYYQGSFQMDDAKLFKRGVHRLGNILVPKGSYGLILEKKIQPILKEIYNEGKRELSTREIVWEFGKRLEKEKNRKNSIIYNAWKNKIPIYVPGITDGAFGTQLWIFSQDHDLKVNVLKDETELSDIVFGAKKSGALVIGGGISKHHTIWWNQFKDGLDYVIYITTAVEWDGSLSGAQVREAISWGKVRERAMRVNIEGDATVILPLMLAAFLERV